MTARERGKILKDIRVVSSERNLAWDRWIDAVRHSEAKQAEYEKLTREECSLYNRLNGVDRGSNE